MGFQRSDKNVLSTFHCYFESVSCVFREGPRVKEVSGLNQMGRFKNVDSNLHRSFNGSPMHFQSYLNLSPYSIITLDGIGLSKCVD